MSTRQKSFFTRAAFVLCIVFLVGIIGCDKIPFLEKYFPSLSKDKEKKETAPSVSTVTKPVMRANTLARVGQWTITKEEFEDKLYSLKELFPDYDVSDAESKKTILEELIRQQLLVEDAERSGLARKKDIVEAVEEFRRTLLVQEVAAKITEDIEVRDYEAKDFYDKNKDSFTEAIQWRIREIAVSTQTEAKEILIELLKGADFASMAKERSKNKSAEDGGDLGYIEEASFPQMENALISLDVGEISSIFKGPDGYYIIKPEDKKGGGTKSFIELREDIVAGLTLMKQQQAILEYIENLKGKTTIEINERLLGE